MALEFELSLKTSFTTEEIIDLILKETNFIKSQKGKDDGNFYTVGFICWVNLMDELSQDIKYEEFNIKTNLSLRFWHDYGNYKDGLRNILKAVWIVLQHTTGDVVFAHVLGSASLIRVNGKLTISSSAFFEDEEAMWRFKDVPFEYEVKDLNID